MPNILRDNAMSMMTSSFNWAEDIHVHWHLAGTNTTTTISTLPVPPPHNLSMHRSGIQNPWGTLSHHHHHHHCPQPQCNPPACNSDTWNLWSRTCLFNYLAHLNTHTWRNPEPTQPVFTYAIKMVHHPQGIGPMKPIFCTLLPVHHNMPPTPIQLVEAIHHSQSTEPPSRHAPRPPLLPPSCKQLLAVHLDSSWPSYTPSLWRPTSCRFS